MYGMNTSSEAVAELSAGAVHSDIEVLFRAHYVRVTRVISRVVGDRARSEELDVEVFLKLWRVRKTPPDNVGAWLYRVAVRAGLDELRRRSRRMRYERLLHFALPWQSRNTPEDLHAVSQQQLQVRTVLQRLRPREAQFLILRSQDFTYQEVASILNIHAASIGTLVRRAEESFRKEYVKRYGQH